MGKEQKDQHPNSRGPFFRWADALELIKLAEYFKETGDNKILLQAISICALNDFVIPRWCSLPYLEAFRDVWHFNVKSWDESFGQPNPKGAQMEAKRRKHSLRFAIYTEVTDIKKQNPDVPIDRALFEAIGKEFGICGSFPIASNKARSIGTSGFCFLISVTSV